MLIKGHLSLKIFLESFLFDFFFGGISKHFFLSFLNGLIVSTGHR